MKWRFCVNKYAQKTFLCLIDNTQKNIDRKSFRDRIENVNHITNECSKLSQKLNEKVDQQGIVQKIKIRQY